MVEPEIRLALADSTSAAVAKPYRGEAPNIVVIVLDDLGFAQLGCFGSNIDTPNIDRLASRGVRFTNFHTTAVCSPTRACLLTGRSHHRVGMGMLPDLPVNFPGYTGEFPDNAATIAETLGDNGYATFAIGKWHLVPRDQRASGPFTMWPTGVGFDRYYGFLNGETNQWTPNLVRDQHHVEPPATPDEGYHLDADLADEAITQLRELRRHQRERPFLLWYATGAPHAPHQAPPEWIDRYAGHFDGGWDAWRAETLARQQEVGIVPEDVELSDRPDWVEAWDDIDEPRRRLYARMMEVYAGFLSHTDHHIGRVLDAIDELGETDNTIVALVSDNGCSAEGGPHGSWNQLRHYISDEPDDIEAELAHIDDLGGFRSSGHYPWGWALAGNTPFRRWKRYTLEGGVRDPLIVSWPAQLPADGSIRHQYAHATDVAVTLLELAGIDPPTERHGVDQLSFDGLSLTEALRDVGAPSPRTKQYYECWGSRAIYADGWKAVTNHVNQLTANERDLIEGSHNFNDDQWQLFHLENDFTESRDLAAEQPEKLAELVALWDAEAERNQVLPIDDGLQNRAAHMRFGWLDFNPHHRLVPGDKLHEANGPILTGGFRMTAAFAEGLAAGATGVLCEQGDRLSGWAWFLANDAIHWVLAGDGHEHSVSIPIRGGERLLVIDGTPNDDGFTLTLAADTGATATAVSPMRPPMAFSPDGAFLTVGYGRPFRVSDLYEPPFPAPASLTTVHIDTGPPPPIDFDQLLADVMRHQ